MQLVSINSPSEVEARAWLASHKDECNLSWQQIAKLTDVASSTLSLFSSGKYVGNTAQVAAKVLAYRDRCAAQIATEAPKAPKWYDTPTADRLTALLNWAQSGEIVLIVTTPGIGKTKVAQRFAERDPNVWLATMSPSTDSVATMAIEVGEMLGLGELRGSPQQMSRHIKGRMRGKSGLLIIDEAQELTDKALNELRSWHDQTNVGIALMGNESVVGQMEGRKSALAQISSRFSIRHVQVAPLPGDLEALLDAWHISDVEQRKFLSRVGRMPGALREVTHTIKIAAMTACGNGDELSLEHLRGAACQRNVKLGSL